MERLDDVKATYGNDMLREITEAEEKFKTAMDYDLSTPEAIAAVFDLVGKANRAIEAKAIGKDGAERVRQAMLKFDKVLGLLRREKEKVPKEIRDLAEERETARKKKDFKKADELREKIKALGWAVEDTADGYRLGKA
jgi:cysteinyl-tRNA synthetase